MPAVTTGVDHTKSDVLTIRQGAWGTNKLRSVRKYIGLGAGAVYGVHCNNLKNLARGLVERVFFVSRQGQLERPPKPKPNVFEQLSFIKLKLLHHLRRTTVVPRWEYPSLYSGRKQVVYQRAVDSLHLKAVSRKDSTVRTFVKAEKVNFTSKPDPAPRVIQPRDPRYNVEVGRYLKLFEKELCLGFKKAFGYQVVSKGLNATGTAEVMRANWDRYGKDAVALGLDASRFDQHVSRQALEYEHSVYNSVFKDRNLARLLSWQLENRGVAFTDGHKITYTIDGCRMSGDINTGMGNCLIMSSVVLAYIHHYNIDARLTNNGDDCVLFFARKDLSKFDGIDSWFLDFGFTLTREEPVYRFEQVGFCQSRPVLTGSGWRMVRNPYTAPSKDCVSLLSWDTPADVAAWAQAIGVCGGELCSGVPFWEEYYRRFRVGAIRGDGLDRIRDSGMGYMADGVQSCAVTAESRASFYYAFGMLPDMQEALESSMPYVIPAAVKPMILTSNINIEITPLSQSKPDEAFKQVFQI